MADLSPEAAERSAATERGPANGAALGTIAVTLLVAAGITWAGSQGGVRVGMVPVFTACAILAFAINWAVFVPSFRARTEHWFDLTGSLTYLSLLAAALLLIPAPDARAWLLAALVAAWALRLGTFLFLRIRRDGKDGRFDALKQHALPFLQVWTLQGLWALLTLSCALAAMTAPVTVPLGLSAVLGTLLWVAGFAIEAVADQQKRAFKADPANEGRFITTGLWAWSRHPNYFGEILLWIGIAVIALPTLAGWRWVTVVSPLFVILLLTRISGIPMLESRARKRWGDDPEFQAYVRDTPVLVPQPPRS